MSSLSPGEVMGLSLSDSSGDCSVVGGGALTLSLDIRQELLSPAQRRALGWMGVWGGGYSLLPPGKCFIVFKGFIFLLHFYYSVKILFKEVRWGEGQSLGHPATVGLSKAEWGHRNRR